jgi:ATP-dependent Clp protease ATP-binding subunit ClpC
VFERFSERARRVLFFARYEASQLGSTAIDTEHLLLGLIREGKGLTTRLFADAAIALDDIRDEVLRRVPARPTTPPSMEIPFSAAVKRVLQHTAQEADRLSHDYIGTEHLLLGLLRHAVRLLHPVRAERTGRHLRADVARRHRAAVRPVGHARDATVLPSGALVRRVPRRAGDRRDGPRRPLRLRAHPQRGHPRRADRSAARAGRLVDHAGTARHPDDRGAPR